MPGEISQSTPTAAPPLAERPLSALLSKLLLLGAWDFERDFALSLAVAANVLRVLDPDGRRLRDLPRLTGVSQESLPHFPMVLHRGGFPDGS